MIEKFFSFLSCLYDIKFLILLSIQIIVSYIFVIVLFIFSNIYQKYSNQKTILNEVKYSMRLLETLYSERIQYQNSLQVMKIMVTAGAIQELNNYLSKVISQLVNYSGLTNINNPILAATIIIHQVKAKENNILIKVNCAKPLSVNMDMSISLGKIFDMFLKLLIENMINSKDFKKEISINIQEKRGIYSFDIVTGNNKLFSPVVSVLPGYNKKITSMTDETVLNQRIAEIKRMINEINGCFYFIINEGKISRLKLTLNDNGGKKPLSKTLSV